MKQIEVYVVRFLERVPDALIDLLYYIVLLILSLRTIEILLNISAISEFISRFDSTFGILIFFTLIFVIFIIYYSIYKYLNFVKFTTKELLWWFFIIVIVAVAARVLGWLDGLGLWGGSLLKLLEQAHSVLLVMMLPLLTFFSLIILSYGRKLAGEHIMTTHFKFACFAINDIGKIQNNEINNYKNMHRIYSASKEYKSGINEIKNLLMRGIDLDEFFDLNTKLNLNEILDWLTFSMQYYLFYGGPEQIGAVKSHLERMVGNFDDKHRINANQFMCETLRMYNEMDAYFKNNNIYIARSIKFTDRIKGYLPQALLTIVVLMLSIFLKDYLLN